MASGPACWAVGRLSHARPGGQTARAERAVGEHEHETRHHDQARDGRDATQRGCREGDDGSGIDDEREIVRRARHRQRRPAVAGTTGTSDRPAGSTAAIYLAI
jgi:hypothetical protein